MPPLNGEARNLYGILDTARDERLYQMIQALVPTARCLFEGPLNPAVARAAPYLLPLTPDDQLLRWWRDVGVGQSWGVALRCGADLATLRRHLRTLLRVQLPGGRIALFRFWDPRVLQPFLQACTATDLRSFFGPVSCIYAETEAARVATYSLGNDGRLVIG